MRHLRIHPVIPAAALLAGALIASTLAISPAVGATDAAGDGSTGTWSLAAVPPGPDGRRAHELVYAPEIDLLVTLGGYTEQDPLSSEVWWIDASDPASGWQTLPPDAPGPEPRRSWSGAWDPVRRQIVLFGGLRENPSNQARTEAVGDVWALRFPQTGGPEWMRLHDGSGLGGIEVPLARSDHSTIYDVDSQRIIIHGGRGDNRVLSDTWAFDLQDATWSAMPSGGPPAYGHQAIYDPEGHQMVVTGGWTASTRQVFSLDLDATSWSVWQPQGQAPAVADGAWGYSEELHALVVMAGHISCSGGADPRLVYALELGHGKLGEGSRWQALPDDGTSPESDNCGSRTGMRGAVVPADDRFFVFGGLISTVDAGGNYINANAELLAFDLTTGQWTEVLSDPVPMRPNADPSFAYDSHGHAMWSFGGWRNDRKLWRLDLARGVWEHIDAIGGFPEGIGTGSVAIYDAAGRRMIVQENCSERTWALELTGSPRWIRLETRGDAPNLCYARAVYDPARRRMLVMGGIFPEHWYAFDSSFSKEDYNDRVFALELPIGGSPFWHELDPGENSPVLGWGGGAVYDPIADRVLALPSSGELMLNPEMDVYQLDLSTDPHGAWTRLTTRGERPGPRHGAVTVFDEANNRMIVWGGAGSDNKTYALDLMTPPTWGILQTTNPPDARRWAAGIYDPIGKRLVTYGGWGQGSNEVVAGSRETNSLLLAGEGTVTPAPEELSPDPPPEPQPVIGGTWRPLGPPGSHTADVDIALGSGERILAGTYGANRRTDARAPGIYFSEDAARSWDTASGALMGRPAYEIAQSPMDPSRVYATSTGRARGEVTLGSHYGHSVYVSTDRGASFAAAAAGLPKSGYFALAVHPLDPLTAWTAGELGGVYRTTDGGQSWHSASRGLRGFAIYGLATTMSPEGLRLIAAARRVGQQFDGNGGIFYSDDLGEHWRNAAQTDLQSVVAVDPSAPHRVATAGGRGVWRSDDYGTTWTHVNPRDVHLGAMEFDPSSGGDVLYGAGTALNCDFDPIAVGGQDPPPSTPGMFKSSDGGATWTRLDGAPEEDFCGLAVSGDGQRIFASSTDSGIWYSPDAGTTWEQRSDGLTQRQTVSVAIDDEQPNTYVATGHWEGVFSTRDRGETWTNATFKDRDGPLSHRYVVEAPGRDGTFLMSTDRGGIFRTDDGGISWKSANAGTRAPFLQPGGITYDPQDPDTWYTVNGRQASFEIAVTHDDGDSFEAISVQTEDGAVSPCPHIIVVDPMDSSRLFVGDICGYGIFRTTDGGKTWELADEGLSDGEVTALAINPSDTNEIWAGTKHEGVFRSEDGGETWTAARYGLGYRYVTAIAISPTEPQRVFAAVPEHGVYETNDDGASWFPVMDGMTSRAPVDLKADADGRVIVATDGGGALVLNEGEIGPPPPGVGERRPLTPGRNIRVSNDDFPAHSTVDIARSPTDPEVVVAAAKVFDKTDDWRTAYRFHVGTYRSTDGGDTWESQGQLHRAFFDSKGYRFSSNPTVEFDSDGNPYIIMTAAKDLPTFNVSRQPGGVYIVRSPDGGLTWDQPRPVIETDDVSASAFSFNDAATLAIDRTGGPLDGTLYAAWTLFPLELRRTTHIVTSTSVDSGATWSPPHFVDVVRSFQNQSPELVVAPDSGLYLFWHNYDDWWLEPGASLLMMSRSFDGAATWSPGVRIASMSAPAGTINPNLRAGPLVRAAAAVDPTDGSVTVAWNHQTPTDVDVVAITSETQGALWSRPKVVHSVRLGDQFQPAVAAGPDGTTYVSFFDRRADPANVRVDLSLAWSEDGKEWADGRVTTRMVDPTSGMPFDTLGRGFFGDYQGIAVANDQVYLAWNDTRDRSQQVYFAPVALPPTEASQPGPDPDPTPTQGPGQRGTYPVMPNDPLFGTPSGDPIDDLILAQQWALKKISAPQAWQEDRATGFGIKVAVIDTGVDLQHEDLQCPGKIDLVPGADAVKDGNGPDDIDGHGTHVAGIIGACTNNGTGVAGVAPDATIVPFQVFSSDPNYDGDGDDNEVVDLVDAIKGAADNGAHVINMSLSFKLSIFGLSVPGSGAIGYLPGLFSDIDDAIEYARAKGVVVVAAAGNSGVLPLCEYPAIAEDVICVGATDNRDLKSWYSTFPNKFDNQDDIGPAVVAPGGSEPIFCDIHSESVLSTYALDQDFPANQNECDDDFPGYRDLNGTSMAAPHVAGVAALVYDRVGGTRSTDNAQTVVDAILSSAEDLGLPGYDPVFGEGRVNALAAVQSIPVEPEPTPSESPTTDPSESPTTDPSESPTTDPGPTVPEAPSNLTARAASSSRIELAWTDNSSSESSFALERSVDGTTWQEIATAARNATFHLDMGLDPDTTYSYRIRALNPAGYSPYSNTASATTSKSGSEKGPIKAPAPPTNLNASSSSPTRMDLAWNDNSHDEDGFALERSTDATTWQQITTAARNQTSYSDNGLSANTRYHYRIRAFNTAGHSDYSNTASAKTAAQPPGGGGGGGDPEPTPTQSSTPTPAQSSSEPSEAMAIGTATTTATASDDLVTYNEGFELSGVVSRDDNCTGPLEVAVSRRIHGTTAYESVASTTVDGAGNWGLQVVGHRNAAYVAEVEDTSTCTGEPSMPTDVLVKAKIVVKLPTTCGDYVRGKVMPAYENTMVVLQRRAKGRWVEVASDRLDDQSRFEMSAVRCGLHRVTWSSEGAANEAAKARFRL